jgi:hypothetical protein
VLLARLGKQAVDEGEVECALGGLDQLPAEGGDDGVEAHGGQLGPDGLHIVQAGRGGVMEFAAENEEGLAVDDELRGGAALFKMRRAVLLRGEWGGLKSSEEKKD